MKKKILVLVMILALSLSGCALFNAPCSTAGSATLATAQNIMDQIQTYYGPLQQLVPAIPTAGPALAVGIPLALNTADQALDELGKMIASGCASDNTLNLAQIALNQIKALFALPETKAAMMARRIVL